MTAADIRRIKAEITTLFGAHAGVSPARVNALLPTKCLQGKLYEAHVLATVCEKLVTHEGFTLSLVNGPNLVLKQKGGPINRNFPHFEVRKGGVLLYELWTDIYFSTLSHKLNGNSPTLVKGDYHELDIALVNAGRTGIPSFDSIKIAIECKNTSIKKSIIREILGFRRELGYYDNTAWPTGFTRWPAIHLNTTVGLPECSVHMLYCSDHRVTRYDQNCRRFGIILEHHRA